MPGPVWREKGEGQREQERGPRAFQALRLEGPPRILKSESMTGQESEPLTGPLILLLPNFFWPQKHNSQDALSADYMPGALLSSVLAFSHFILTIVP